MKNASAWQSWSELEIQYKETGSTLKIAREKLGYDGKFRADREILGSMISDVTELAGIIKQKVLYEFGALSEDELSLLTDRQREIAELRQRYNYREIAEILGISSKTAFDVFQKAVRNIKKIKRQRNERVPPGLSPQQEQIYILHNQGKKPKEIALKLNISKDVVYVQLNRIKTLTKSQEN